MKRPFILSILLLSTLTLYAEMKCEAGKCGSGMTKDIPKTTTMKCGEGKCGAAMSKDVPKKTMEKPSNNTSMKCEVGKCSTGKEIPNKISKTSSKNIQNKPTIKQLFNVTTVQVKELVTAKEQINYGYIVAQDTANIDVTSWFSGYVEKLYVDTLYQKVKKGQTLCSVYSPEVYKAKQDYLNALRFNAKRSSPSMVQSAKTKLVLLGVSKQEINDIRNKSKVSRFTNIYAPASGWIFEKNINQGSFLNAKKPLFKIINLSKVWLEAKLFQNELAELDNFNHFTVTVQGMKSIFPAKKELLYPMIDPKEATATLRLSIDNTSEILKPGMYAKLHSTMQKKSTLTIPRTAVIRKSGTWYAFLATEFKGEYEPIKIEVKPLDNKHYEVTSGLNVGDKVVNNALFMMDSDAQINSIY